MRRNTSRNLSKTLRRALVFEHVAQQLLHRRVSDGPVEEEQLDPLRVHEAQRGKEEEQLPKPDDQTEDAQDRCQRREELHFHFKDN